MVRRNRSISSPQTYVKFYNTNDFALAISRWGLDQQLKPDYSITTLGTAYDFFGYPYNGQPHYIPGSADDAAPWIRFGKTIFYTTNYFDMNVINDRYEVSAYAAQARATALGGTVGVGNLTGTLNLGTVWPPDNSTTDPNKKYSAHFWHSAEFRGDSAQEWNYWRTLLFSSQSGFNISNP